MHKLEKLLLNAKDDQDYEDLIKKAIQLEYLTDNWEPEVILDYYNRLTP